MVGLVNVNSFDQQAVPYLARELSAEVCVDSVVTQSKADLQGHGTRAAQVQQRTATISARQTETYSNVFEQERTEARYERSRKNGE